MNSFITPRRFLIPSASLRPRMLVTPTQIQAESPAYTRVIPRAHRPSSSTSAQPNSTSQL